MRLPRLDPGLALGVFFFALMIAFVPGWIHAATAPRWALMAVAVPALLWVYRPAPISGLPFVLGMTAFAYATLSLAWSSGPYEGVDQLLRLMLLAGLFMVGTEAQSLQPVYIGAGLGLAINSAVAIAQVFGFDAIPQLTSFDRISELVTATRTIGPGGLFINLNFMAEPAVLVLIGLMAWRRWWLAALVAPAALLPGARGALLGLAAAGVVWIWRYSWKASLGFAIVLVAGAAIWHGVNHSISTRLDIWRDTLAALTWWGHGIGSFFVEFPAHATHINTLVERPTHAHSDMLELVYELGIGALPLLGLAVWALMAKRVPIPGDDVARPENLVLIAFLTEACFGYPLHLPATAALAAVVAGHLCRRRVVVWDHVRFRRAELCPGVFSD